MTTNDWYFMQDEHSKLIDQMKLIRAKVKLRQETDDFHSLMITSPTNGDGKTTVAVNLALELANLKEKVILLDANLGSQSKFDKLGLNNTGLGLSDYLKDTQDNPSSSNIAYETSVSKYLTVIPNINPVGNSTDLLCSDAMTQLLTQLDKDFDIVIIDTPSLTNESEGFTIANLVDQTILVVRIGKTKKDLAEKSIELLQESKSTLMGIVYNA